MLDTSLRDFALESKDEAKLKILSTKESVHHYALIDNYRERTSVMLYEFETDDLVFKQKQFRAMRKWSVVLPLRRSGVQLRSVKIMFGSPGGIRIKRRIIIHKSKNNVNNVFVDAKF